MGKTISVIVPVYKVEQYLDECVYSIINQSFPSLEIILVDDGSPDHCPAMCDAWAEKDSRIKVIHKPNGGLSSARNAGLDICTGDFIAFVDSDDWIKPDMYQHMLDVIERENADICACAIISCYPHKNATWGGDSYIVGDSTAMLDRLYSDSIFPASALNKLYRRKLWDNLRFPEGKICEDAFTTYLLLHKAERIVQIPEALYCYRIRPNSIMTSAFSKRSMDEEEAWRVNYEFIRENYPKLYRKAFSFYLQSVHVLISRMENERRGEFRDEYAYLHQKLRDNLVFMLFCSTTSFKYRIKFLLDYLRF